MNATMRLGLVVLALTAAAGPVPDALAVSFDESVLLSGEEFVAARRELVATGVPGERLGRALASSEWREQLTAVILDGWLRYADTYEAILEGPRQTDQLGNELMPGIRQAAMRGVNVLPLIYEMLVKETAPPAALLPLSRQVQALGRSNPEMLRVQLLASALADPGELSEPFREQIARVLAVTDSTNLAVETYLGLLRKEVKRDAPSRAVEAALLNGVIRSARQLGPSRTHVIQQIMELRESSGLSPETFIHVAGEVGGAGAEELVIQYLETAEAETEKRWALNALARVNTDRALKVAFEYAAPEAKSQYLRESAIGSLGRYSYREEIVTRLEEIALDRDRATIERKKAIDSFEHLHRMLMPESPALKEVERRLQLLDQRDLEDQELRMRIDSVMRSIESEADER